MKRDIFRAAAGRPYMAMAVVFLLMAPGLAMAWMSGPWKGLDPAHKVKTVVLDAVAPGTANATGEGKAYFVWPYAGTWELVSLDQVAAPGASELTASTSGVLTVQVYNVTDSADMLSTAITVDEDETDSSTAATPPVIDASHNTVTLGDRLRVDVDVAGDGYGCQVRLPFRKL